ncbi:hypothetical protein CEP51_000487 [Fusarium floridanum]|uniref:Peptidase C14 caspase domain-containing protein n=1 Tax=Fusarium floridanum TaxID=1325733 RepID=A0A428SMC6_9HYPO|nr:hypothetical protein CEP51_000487 [Fusarium floridanum]
MAEASNQGRKSALLIGINKYNSSGLNDLRGCLSDVATTEAFLTKVAGISRITKLISPPASPNDTLPTRSNILSKFKTLADNAQPGDFIYIHYSGHGTRRATKFGDLKGESVNLDECLVLPIDGKLDSPRDGEPDCLPKGELDCLRDVEIAFLLKQIADKGATVTFVLDCCHAGGATRGDDDDDAVRGSDEIPDKYFVKQELIQSVDDLKDVWGLPLDNGDDGGRGGSVIQHWMTASKGINFLAACQPQQKAQEFPLRADVRKGLLTDCLDSVVNAKDGGADRLPQLSCDVVSNLVAHALKNHKWRNTSKDQDVVFGGQGDCHIFGVKIVPEPTVVVTSVEKSRSDGELKLGLTAGIAHDVSVGDIFAIYPSDRPLNNVADYTAPLATCRVTAVESFTCNAETLEGAANLEQVQVGCVAVSLRSILKDHVLQPKGVWVSAADDSAESLDSVVQKVRDYISRGSRLVELRDAGQAFFKVMVRKAGSFTISFTPNQTKAKVEVTGKPEDVLSRLEHLTVFYNLFSLATDNAEQQGPGLTVRKIGYLEKNVSPPAPRPFQLNAPSSQAAGLKGVGEDSIDILEGQSLGIEVRNTSLESMYVEILDLEPSWKVTRTYPMPRKSPILVPPNGGTHFFIKMGPSDKVPGAVQPDTFDRFVVLATLRNQGNFPETVLPKLDGGEGPVGSAGSPPVLEPDDGDAGRGGVGVAQPAWFVQKLDARVIKE